MAARFQVFANCVSFLIFFFSKFSFLPTPSLVLFSSHFIFFLSPTFSSTCVSFPPSHTFASFFFLSSLPTSYYPFTHAKRNDHSKTLFWIIFQLLLLFFCYFFSSSSCSSIFFSLCFSSISRKTNYNRKLIDRSVGPRMKGNKIFRFLFKPTRSVWCRFWQKPIPTNWITTSLFE